MEMPKKKMPVDGDASAFLYGTQQRFPSTIMPLYRKKEGSDRTLVIDVGYKTFYEEMKPLFMILRIMGIFPYHVTPSGNLSFSMCSVEVLYSLVFLAAMSVMAGTVLSHRINEGLKDDAFSILAAEYGARMFLSLVLLTPLFNWPEIKKKIRFVNNFRAFQREYLQLTRRPLTLGMRKKLLLQLMVCFLVITLFTVFSFFADKARQWWQIYIVILAYAITTILPFTWVFTCSVLEKAASIMSNDLEQCFSSHVRAENIRQFRRLWLNLSCLCEELGSSTGLSLGTQIIFFFIISILVTYSFLSGISNGIVYLYVIIASFFIFTIFLVCNAAYSTTQELDSKFSMKLDRLSDKIPLSNTVALNETRVFLATISAHADNVSLCGFANVNRGLVTSFISVMVTYLLVLLQLEQAEIPAETTTTRTDITNG